MADEAAYYATPTMHGFTPGFAGAIAGGGALLLITLGMTYALLRQHRRHKRLLADLEQRGIPVTRPSMARLSAPCLTKPRNTLRRSTFLPYGSASAWGSLASREDVDCSNPATAIAESNNEKSAKRNSSSRLSWPFSRLAATGRASLVSKSKSSHLSAIVESPRCLVKIPSPRQPVVTKHPADTIPSQTSPEERSLGSAEPSQQTPPAVADHPELDVENSVTITPTIRRVSTEEAVPRGHNNCTRSGRSKSIPSAIPSDLSINCISRISRPQMHARSISLTSQHVGLVPSGPVPPLPPNVAANDGKCIPQNSLNRTASKNSVSSLESAGSSILIAKSSPLIFPNPSVQLKEGANRAWNSSVVVGPRSSSDKILPDIPRVNAACQVQASRGSMADNVARYSINSLASSRLSHASSDASPLGNKDRLSVDNIKTAETVRFSRISSSSSVNKNIAVQALSTPRRHSRSKVSLLGSPSERRRHSILRDVSGNQTIPTRQLSQTSSAQASSTRSSNGNPFQWDPSPLQSGKPSAMKGSPTSRKGHRRQNCVRISLAPTILGSSRSPSPSNLNGIKEESPDTDAINDALISGGLKVSKTRSLPRPPSSSEFAPHVKLNPTTLRASLTPSSPTLSLARFDQDDAFSPNTAKYTSPPSSPPARNPARLSTASSIFTIPTFPKPAQSWNNIQTVSAPTFAFQCPSNDLDEENTPPVTFELLTQPISPADLALTSHADGLQQYDPESPIIPGLKLLNKPSRIGQQVGMETRTTSGDEGLASQNRTSDSISPPSSSRSTQPHAFLPLPQNEPSTLGNVSITQHKSEVTPPTSTPSPTRPPPGPPVPEDRPTTTPQGPRSEPPKDVRKAVMQLRRMNSEAEICHRPDRRYLRMGREASPALPSLPGTDSRASLTSQDDAGSDTNRTSSDAATSAEGAVRPGLVKRASSVWEDGERFWDAAAAERRRMSMGEVGEEGAARAQRRSAGAPRSPKRRSDLRRSAILAAAAVTPVVTVQAPSARGTPGSLYDQDGFLRA